jgi:hypothetical protein
MRLILLTLFAPVKAAEQIKSNPRWVVAFLFFSVVSATTYALNYPYLTQATVTRLPSTATLADKQEVVESLRLELPTKLAFFPVRMFVGWGIFSVALFYVSRAFAPREALRFEQVLSVEVHAEVSSIVANLITLILTLTSEDGKLADLPLSLAGVIHAEQDFVIKSLLTTLNIFTLWYIVFLTIAVATLCNLRKLKSLLVVLLVWTFSTMLNLGAMKILMDELHLLF